MTVQETREIPPEIQQRRDTWWRQLKKWSFIHYTLGIVAVVCSTIAAAIAHLELTLAQIPLSVIAAICAGLITFLKPANRAATSLRAWSLLDAACTEYKYNSEYPIQSLLDAEVKGQLIVQNEDVDQSS